jgi:hypothetical protein
MWDPAGEPGRIHVELACALGDMIGESLEAPRFLELKPSDAVPSGRKVALEFKCAVLALMVADDDVGSSRRTVAAPMPPPRLT